MAITTVFDTNILFSATGWRGNPFQCIERARAGEIQAVTCPELVEETHLCAVVLTVPGNGRTPRFRQFALEMRSQSGGGPPQSKTLSRMSAASKVRCILGRTPRYGQHAPQMGPGQAPNPNL